MVDPTGKWSSTSVTVSVSIGIAWAGANGFVNYQAGKSVGAGIVGGTLGGVAIAFAYNSGQLGKVLWSALTTAALSYYIQSAISLLKGDGWITGWEAASVTMEGINYGAHGAMWIDPWGGSGIGSYYDQGFLSAATNFGSGEATFLIDTYSMYLESRLAQFRGLDPPETSQFAGPMVDALTGFAWGTVIDLVATAPTDYVVDRWLKGTGLKHLPAQTKRKLADGLRELVEAGLDSPILNDLAKASPEFVQIAHDWLKWAFNDD